MIKKILVILLAVVFSFLIALAIALAYYWHGFSRATGIKTGQFLSQARAGVKNPYQPDYLTFLVLGLDQRPGEETLLTDTILLTAINAKTGDYLLFSLPRDLWLGDLKTKINALYYYGHKADPNDGSSLVKERVEKILDWPIDYVMVLKMEQIKQLIDLLGGIEIEVEHSFTDRLYPKDDGSGETITISFKEGKQLMDGEAALQFMRSRQSEDPIEGTDQARQQRQKKVILAIKDRLIKKKDIWKSGETMGELYLFLTREMKIKPEMDLETIASFWPLAKAFASGGEQKEAELPWQGEKAILVADRDPLYQSWILLPKNNDWSLIRDYFQSQLP